jgi:two-component system cell cycle response regulator CtrA
MRILLIEDDLALATGLRLTLQARGFNVYVTESGEEGLELARMYDYDAVVLDLNLPDMTGQEALRALRSAKVSTPVLVLSGTTEDQAKIAALTAGADDYVTKPFNRDELVARLHAIVRRTRGFARPVIAIGDLTLDITAKSVRVNGERIHLTAKEYQILELLALRKGVMITKEMFLNHLYGGMDEPEAKIIDVFICKLRKKLAAFSAGGHKLETVWGRGYVLREAEELAAAA